MLIRCNAGCKLKGGSTTGSLDVERNEVVCDHCGEDIAGISSFAKNAMKSSGDIVRKKDEPFQFKCQTCNKTVGTALDENDNLVGVACEKGNCSFEGVTEHIVHAMKAIGRRKGEINYE